MVTMYSSPPDLTHGSGQYRSNLFRVVLTGLPASRFVVAIFWICALKDRDPEALKQIKFFLTTGVAEDLSGKVVGPILPNRVSHVRIGLVNAGTRIPSLAQSVMSGLADVHLPVDSIFKHIHDHLSTPVVIVCSNRRFF